MQYRFNKNLEALGIERGARVMAALSGGADSMVMLMLLKNSNLDLRICAAHVNFHLRGDESNEDERFVTDWCRSNDIQIVVKHSDTYEYANEHRLSVEMSAREIRYDWFFELAKERNIKYIAVAHNANDNAETLLLNLTRGCGLEGCTSIKERREADGNLIIVRPLLKFTRDDIEHCARNIGIPFRTDSTNTDIRFSRNRIRHVVLPALAQINSSAVRQINRSISYLTSANNLLQSLLKEQDSVVSDECTKMLSGLGYMHYPSCRYMVKAMAIKKLQLLLEPELLLHDILSRYGFTSAQQDGLSASLHSGKPISFVSDNYLLQKERGVIKIYRKEVDNIPHEIELNSSFSGIVQYSDLEIHIEQKDYMSGGMAVWKRSGDEFVKLTIDREHLGETFTISPMQPGDRMRPLGMRGTKKVADILSDLKVDLPNKKFIPVIRNQEKKIVALAGIMLSDSFKVTSSTKSVIEVSIPAKY